MYEDRGASQTRSIPDMRAVIFFRKALAWKRSAWYSMGFRYKDGTSSNIWTDVVFL